MGSVSLIGPRMRVDLAAQRARDAGVHVGKGPVFATDAESAAENFGDRFPWCASRPALYARLEDADVRVAPWVQAASLADARAALERLGLPAVVKTFRPGSVAAMRVDHGPDLDLAFAKTSGSGSALVQRMENGIRLCVDAVVGEGSLMIAAVTEKRSGGPPFLFPMSLAVPALLPADAVAPVTHTVSRLAAALNAPPGPLAVDLAVSGEYVAVLGAALCPGDAAFYGELIDRAHGSNHLGACARAAAGMSVEVFPAPRQGAAVAWVSAHSGIVTGVAGLERARAMTGVVETAVNPPPGTWLRHATGPLNRDVAGYVAATGVDAAEALARATAGVNAVEILRQHMDS